MSDPKNRSTPEVNARIAVFRSRLMAGCDLFSGKPLGVLDRQESTEEKTERLERHRMLRQSNGQPTKKRPLCRLRTSAVQDELGADTREVLAKSAEDAG
jgi:hypothetical protein